jgi:F-type H+-transporting ATPase subunit epsilon
MARTLLCEIVTPERIVYTQEAVFVVAPTTDGEVGIMPLHQPIVAALKPGEVRVQYGDEKEWEWFAISGGYLQVHEDKVIILADDAVNASHIDAERAKHSLDLATARKNELSGREVDDVELSAIERDLAWAEMQMSIAAKRR